MPDDQIMNVIHSGRVRIGVKYTQWVIGPRYAPRRDAVVVYWSTSPVAPET